MSDSPQATRVVRQWVEKAEHDLRNAEHTLTLQEDCPFDTVCFHAQQCAEKYIKALLVLQAVDFPKTHDLGALAQLVPPDLPLGVDLAELVILNRYGIEARYPGDWEPIARDDAEHACSLARSIRQRVRDLLPAEIPGE
jgi:HEPN domain-containing protein